MNIEITQMDICRWARETFGHAELGTLVARCNEEMAELITATQGPISKDALRKIVMECADVFIVLCQVADATGLRLEWAIEDKMKTNKARKWKTDGQGVGQHE